MVLEPTRLVGLPISLLMVKLSRYNVQPQQNRTRFRAMISGVDARLSSNACRISKMQ